MTEIAIRVKGLGKSYWIAHRASRTRYRTLRDDILALPRQMWALVRDDGGADEMFWALHDISFEVNEGEVVGVIGRNGAGKSTLLKILSRITEPTTGYADVFGRVGSLLEIGTGFHPELTGRENIYLSGAVLGMRRDEVRRKFDEIVDFAEVEKFIDTPAKYYSSGMYMRLAFAVAAHLEPEILLVDEVLAVGDAKFQKKCLGKMGEVARGGRTVLFVSHNMAAVQQLCHYGIVLNAGQVVFNGHIEEAIRHYMTLNADMIKRIDLSQRRDRQGDQSLRFDRVEIYDAEGHALERVLSGQDVHLRFYYASQKIYSNASVWAAFNVYNERGVLLTNLNSKDVGRMQMPIYREGYLECLWRRFNLRSGLYTCTLFCEVNGVIVDWIQSAFEIDVDDGDYYGTGSLISRAQGDILVNYDWASAGL